MFDPKIDKSYCNSQGEFVDVYAELRLPDGPESSKDAITQAYRNFVRACHPDVCKDKKLAEAMTTFANRARAVLTMERAPYNEKWRQERGRKKKTNRSQTDSSSRSWIPAGVGERVVGCIVPLVGVGVVAVGLTALYNWSSDQLRSIPAGTSDLEEPVSKFQSGWFKVDASKVDKLVGETQVEPGMEREQEGEIVKHKACAAFTISCQNGVMNGYSFYWLKSTCPPLMARAYPEATSYPGSFQTDSLSWPWRAIYPYKSSGEYSPSEYPDIIPHPHIVCSKQSNSEGITGYRTFLKVLP